MRYLIHQLLNDHAEAIADRTLLHCHLPGLHSIVLIDQPGCRLRLFYMTTECRMETDLHEGVMNLAIHPHHCNLSIEMVYGSLLHFTFEKTDELGIGVRLREFTYQSAITHGQGKVTPVGEAMLRLKEKRRLIGDTPERNGIHLRAHELHTLSRRSVEAIWLITEGAEDPDYQPVSYAFDDLSNYDFSSLYQKPTRQEAYNLFSTIKKRLSTREYALDDDVQRRLDLTRS